MCCLMTGLTEQEFMQQKLVQLFPVYRNFDMSFIYSKDQFNKFMD